MTRKMKDSGIEWIGEIPENWETVKLKNLVLDRQAGVWGKDESEDNVTNNKVCIRIADFDYSRMSIRKDREFTLRNYTDNEITKCSLRKDDILIEKSGGGEKTPVGRTIIWNEDFQALYANFIERLRVDKKQILPMFAQFCFFAFYGIGGSNLYFNQTTGIQNLNITGMMNDLRLPTPDLSTQIKIVDILDRKRKQIENIKSTILQEIQTLEDYKKSLITEVVTKGLDKNVEMKGSGIEWIGDIPKHWEIIKIKDAFTRKNSKANIEKPVILSLARSGIKIRDISNNEGQLAADYSNYNPVDINDLLLNPMDLISGDNCNISKVKGVISPAYINLRFMQGTNPEFYNLYFKNLYWSKVFFAHGKGVSFENRWTLNYETLSQMKIPYPPILEQDRIADYLVNKIKTTDDTIANKQKQLETLEEYKKSLIYEYVTGKKEVKDGEES